MRCAYCALLGLAPSVWSDRRRASCEARRKIFSRTAKFTVDIIPIGTYHERVLSDEGPLSRGDPSADRARAGRTGAPRNGRRPGGQVERREALRLALGARGALPREVGTLIPPPRVPAGALAPPAAPPPRAGSRGTGKPRTHCAARTRKCWLFELWIGNLSEAPLKPRPALSRGEVDAHRQMRGG